MAVVASKFVDRRICDCIAFYNGKAFKTAAFGCYYSDTLIEENEGKFRNGIELNSFGEKHTQKKINLLFVPDQ
jgi:hypothetical protein